MTVDQSVYSLYISGTNRRGCEKNARGPRQLPFVSFPAPRSISPPSSPARSCWRASPSRRATDWSPAGTCPSPTRRVRPAKPLLREHRASSSASESSVCEPTELLVGRGQSAGTRGYLGFCPGRESPHRGQPSLRLPETIVCLRVVRESHRYLPSRLSNVYTSPAVIVFWSLHWRSCLSGNRVLIRHVTAKLEPADDVVCHKPLERSRELVEVLGACRS